MEVSSVKDKKRLVPLAVSLYRETLDSKSGVNANFEVNLWYLKPDEIRIIERLRQYTQSLTDTTH